MKDPKKLPATNKYTEALIKQRKPENAISSFLNGHLDISDLHKDEREMYDRYVRLTASVLERKGKFDRTEVLTDHMLTFNIGIATAQRDLAFVNSRMTMLMDAEMELHKLALYNKAWEGIRIAEENEDPKGIAANIKEARELLGIGKEGKASSEKIEQHVNIIIADDTTKDVMLKILEKNISVHEYNMTLDEILAKEQELQKTIDIPHEDLGNHTDNQGD